MADTPRPDDTDDEPSGPTASGPSIPAEVVEEGHQVGPVDDDEDAMDLAGLLGGGGLDLGNLMEQATQMQQQMAAAQEAAAGTVLEGVAGGGAVKVTVTGAGEYHSVTIDPAAVDPAEVAMLEDLVLAALHDAATRIQELQSRSMGGLGDLLGGG